jgi:hypothetical protein
MQKSLVSRRRHLPGGVLRGERRARKRYLAPPLFCRVLAPNLPNGVVAILDVSAGGIGLALPDRVEPGTILRLRLSNRDHLCVHDVELRVVHCWGPPGVPSLAGGPFVHALPHDVLCALLR